MGAKARKSIEVLTISVRNLKTPQYVARETIKREGINELADDIKANGLINPLTVKPVKGGYEVIAGHRRLSAVKKLGWTEVYCTVRANDSTDAELVKFAENMQRENLNDVEVARSIEHIMKMTKKTAQQVARLLNRSVDYVKQHLAIMTYPDRLFGAIAEEKISFSAARELMRINDTKIIDEYTKHAVNSGITPAIAKQWADDYLDAQKQEAALNDGEDYYKDTIIYEEPEYPCYFCGKTKTADKSRMIRVCNSCEKKMNNAG